MSTKRINKGSDHYKHYAIEPIVFIIENKLDFVRGSIIKYLMRLPYSKDPQGDIKKIEHYTEMLKEI